MTSPAFWQIPEPARRTVFADASERLHILPHMVEKDAWVCWTLRELFALPGAHDHFIFKGGTSLSKVWKVIHRFSEDIDISLSREWLGFSGARDPEAAASRKQRAKLLDELSAACAEKLATVVAPALRARIAAACDSAGWSLDVSPDDPQTLLFAYPTVYDEGATAGYVRPVVKIKCGARSDRWPVSPQPLAPYLAEAFPQAFPDASFNVPVLGIERTFWEKATILHAEAHRPVDKPVPDRFSRHYADLAALASHPECEAALARTDLRERVVAHKQVFFAASWASYETAVPGTFELLPSPQRLTALAADYRAMQDMFFRPPSPWSDIVATLTALETRINALRP
jgi:hypothetical protein